MLAFSAAVALTLNVPAFAQSQGNGDGNGNRANNQPTLDELLEVGKTEQDNQQDHGEKSESGAQQDEQTRREQRPGSGEGPGTHGDSNASGAPATQPRGAARDKGGSGSVAEDLRQRLKREQKQDPFASAVQQMRTVAQRLGRDLNPGDNTQRMQKRIIKKLDQVLAKARKQQKGGGSQSQNQQKKRKKQGQKNPAQRKQRQKKAAKKQGGQQSQSASARGSKPSGSSGENGSTNASEAESMEALRQQWGNLPPRLRNELSESLDEQFSPVYQSRTEAYYRRLAEQMRNGEAR